MEYRERAEAARALKPFAEGRARTTDWKTLYECGAPLVRDVFLPSRWTPRRWYARDLRLLQAIGVGGATVRLLNAVPLLETVTLRDLISRWTYRINMAALPTQIVFVEEVLEKDPRWHELFSEVMLFDQVQWLLLSCGRDLHFWIGPRRRNFCPVHQAAGVKARHRSSPSQIRRTNPL